MYFKEQPNTLKNTGNEKNWRCEKKEWNMDLKGSLHTYMFKK
jgi:hypothetical protein